MALPRRGTSLPYLLYTHVKQVDTATALAPAHLDYYKNKDNNLKFCSDNVLLLVPLKNAGT